MIGVSKTSKPAVIFLGPLLSLAGKKSHSIPIPLVQPRQVRQIPTMWVSKLPDCEASNPNRGGCAKNQSISNYRAGPISNAVRRDAYPVATLPGHTPREISLAQHRRASY